MKFYFLLATFFFSVTAFCQTVDEDEFARIKQEADSYKSRAVDASYSDIPKKVGYFSKAAALYRKAGAFNNEGDIWCEVSILYNTLDDPATSIKYAQQAIKVKKEHNITDLCKEYAMLGLNYRIQGKYQSALSYALAAEKMSEKSSIDKQMLSIIYDLIATIYSELKYHDQSVIYYKKAIEVSKEINDIEGVNSITINTARDLLSRNKVTEALEILNGATQYNKGENWDIEYSALYILIYCRLKKYEKARPYYERLLKYSQHTSVHKNHIREEKLYYAMVRYLLHTGQADKTYVYINHLKELAKQNNDLFNLAEIEQTHFESDSATGNYIGAIQHLKAYKELNDSLFNINSTKQFADLQLKYETEKKDKNISLLKQKGELQQIQLHNEEVIRYIFIGGFIILLIILGLLYNRNKLKQRVNKKLEAKQEEINRQNKILQQLVDEKEWLLKEIHHRVKNNLQIVISLLNSQSAYLDNEDALLAIQNSQNRMHAMSLIHQKLYQTENLSSIDMAWYIKELVNYLTDCFVTDSTIRFEIDTDNIELDVAQAVPLGLILNEAISNAIKYAFPDKRGLISIGFKKTKECEYLLKIADNGVGLPENFENEERDSLGMNLMTGLAQQLDGDFNIVSDNGVTITINFIKRRAEV
ncbi:histidine kinase dimerization/phosphoacceptor domain -containing protein [Flavobacterium sp. RHBU_3]|uniref:tetratricopeptide repeat-containing sensor histidine kinase n=1 Tax=Flavobacterium sp. RHBU_3 TaxID=3391184 RepID=UPI0039847AB7